VKLALEILANIMTQQDDDSVSNLFNVVLLLGRAVPYNCPFYSCFLHDSICYFPFVPKYVFIFRLFLLLPRSTDLMQVGLNYIDVLNTDAFLSDGNPHSTSSSSTSTSSSLTASSDKKAQSSPAVALVLKQFAEQDFRIRYHAMHLLEVFCPVRCFVSFDESSSQHGIG
jgi:hypothetical protein